MAKQLFIIDPCIIDATGHYAAYARAIRNHAVERGLRVRVLAHQCVSQQLIDELGAERVFRYSLTHRFISIPGIRGPANVALCNLTFLQDLTRALATPGEQGFVVFAPTTDHRQLFAWARWLAKHPAGSDLRIILCFRYSYFAGGGEPISRLSLWLAKAGFRMLARAARGSDIRIATDSERLAEEYRRLTNLPIDVLPIPHTDDLTGPAPAPPARDRRPVRFAALGDARAEKGFGLLVDAITLLHQNGQLDNLEFALQCHIGHERHNAVRRRFSQLSALGLANVHVISGMLSRTQYLDLLQGSDIILLPYSAEHYYARTSGAFAEALAAGKPVIVTDDTWMSEQLAVHGAGLIIQDGDPADLARAIREAAARHVELAAAARERRRNWLAWHNPECLLQRIGATDSATADHRGGAPSGNTRNHPAQYR